MTLIRQSAHNPQEYNEPSLGLDASLERIGKNSIRFNPTPSSSKSSPSELDNILAGMNHGKNHTSTVEPSKDPCSSRDFFSTSTAIQVAGGFGAKFLADATAYGANPSVTQGLFHLIPEDKLSTLSKQGSGLYKLGQAAKFFRGVSLVVPAYFIYKDFADASVAPKEQKAQATSRAMVNLIGTGLAYGLGFWIGGPVGLFVVAPIVGFIADQMKSGVGKDGSIAGIFGRKEYNPNSNPTKNNENHNSSSFKTSIHSLA